MNLEDMIPLHYFPAINAFLNALCTFFLVLGLCLIKCRKRLAHQISMLCAFAVSIIFLMTYLYYHYHHGVTRFEGTGWVRGLYFLILISHTILAVIVPPMASVTLYRAFKGQFDRHRRIARWTFPIWLYVSITGVVVYWMLYR